MDPAAYVEMDAIEGRHWWFRGKRRLVGPLVERMLAGRAAEARAATVLEVGCGTGGNLEHFAERHPTARFIGLDFDPGAADFARAKGDAAERGFDVLRGDGLGLPLADGSVAGAMALDIVEHLDDHHAVLAELFRVLEPGADLVLSVPAWPGLWSPHDEFLHHKRRYLPAELVERVRGAGFEVTERRGFNFLLLPPIWLVRRLKSAKGRAASEGGEEAGGTDFFDLPAPVNALLAGLFAVEAALVRMLPIKSGVSLLLRATKPGA